MHHRFEAHGSENGNFKSVVKEVKQWKHEQDEWLHEIADWDKQLRRLMLLIHDLDNAFPDERQMLAAHHDAIDGHRKLLEKHSEFLNKHNGKSLGRFESGDSDHEVPSAITDNHTRQRFQHLRVRDSHLELRRRHKKAMKQVTDLMDQFCKRLG